MLRFYQLIHCLCTDVQLATAQRRIAVVMRDWLWEESGIVEQAFVDNVCSKIEEVLPVQHTISIINLFNPQSLSSSLYNPPPTCPLLFFPSFLPFSLFFSVLLFSFVIILNFPSSLVIIPSILTPPMIQPDIRSSREDSVLTYTASL